MDTYTIFDSKHTLYEGRHRFPITASNNIVRVKAIRAQNTQINFNIITVSGRRPTINNITHRTKSLLDISMNQDKGCTETVFSMTELLKLHILSDIIMNLT